MKIRSCFVSNSSSSSFICSIPNYSNDLNPMKIDFFNDRVNDAENDEEKEKWQKIIKEYTEKCRNENIIMFDVYPSWTDYEDVIGTMERKIPGFKVVSTLDEID